MSKQELASSVELSRNLARGSISTQFHVVYDNWFSTVTSNGAKTPENGEELLTISWVQIEGDANNVIPELSEEWLDDQELAEREQHKQSQCQGHNQINILPKNGQDVIPEGNIINQEIPEPVEEAVHEDSEDDEVDQPQLHRSARSQALNR